MSEMDKESSSTEASKLSLDRRESTADEDDSGPSGESSNSSITETDENGEYFTTFDKIVGHSDYKGIKIKVDKFTEALMKANLVNRDNYKVKPPFNVAQLQELIDQGANAKAGSTFGVMALNYAVSSDCKMMIELLVKNGVDVNYLGNVGRHGGYSPLMLAVRYQSLNAIEHLITFGGANPNLQGLNGETALHQVVRNWNSHSNSNNVLQLLLKLGAQLEMKNQKGQTPLALACSQKKISVVKGFLECGACIDCKNPINLYTPLHEAANAEATDVVKLLIEYNADINVRAQHGTTPMHCAISKKCVKVARVLISNGALADKSKFYLHDVIRYNNSSRTESNSKVVELVKLLLEHEDINRLDLNRCTALQLAIRNGIDLAITDVLIEHVVKLTHLNFEVSETNLAYVKWYLEDKVESCNNQCLAEIERMKSHIICKNRVFNIHQLFSEPVKRMIRFFQLEETKRKLLDKNFSIRFPLYGNLIGKRVQMLAEKAQLYSQFGSFFASIFNGELFLPENVVERIMSYFSEEEIRDLLNDE